MPTILLHNISIPFLNQPKDLFSFDQNAIYFADKEDVVLLREVPNKTLLDFLQKENIISSDITYITSRLTEDPFHVFKDTELIQKLEDFFVSHDNQKYQFDVFMPTVWEQNFAVRFSITYPYLDKQYEQYVSKGLFRESSKKTGVPVSKGYSFCSSRQDFLLALLRLFVQGVQEVVIKQDDGVSGNGFARVSISTFIRNVLTFQMQKFLPNTHVYPTAGRGYVIEQWHRNVLYAPSIQCFISEDGDFSILSIHNQLMRENGITYAGCQSEKSLPESVRNSLAFFTKQFSQSLIKSGFSGHFALNAIVDTNLQLYFTEINPRRVISSYPFQIIQRLGYTQENIPHYTAIEITRTQWKGSSADEVFDNLRHILYSKKKGSGVIPFDMKLLDHNGTVMMLAVAETAEEVKKYIELCRI